MSAKPLVWTKPTDHPCDHDGSLWCANGIGGRYSITKESDHFLLWLAEDEFIWRSHPTVKAAKEAAEADWQAAYLKAAAPLTTVKGEV